MLAAVRDRLDAQVPELSGRVRLAEDFAKLRANGQAPTGGVAAFVLPSGRTGLQASASSGAFVQGVRIGVSIVTMIQSGNAAGDRALARIDELLSDISHALCGWAPGDTVGVFELQSERPVPGERGLLSFLTDFRITDQLRVLK